MTAMDQDDFSNVPWQSQQDHAASSSSHEDSNGHILDEGDLGPHALGPEKLECTVSQPIKENDGTKDAFVSYLITTTVCYEPANSEPCTPGLQLTYRGSSLHFPLSRNQ